MVYSDNLVSCVEISIHASILGRWGGGSGWVDREQEEEELDVNEQDDEDDEDDEDDDADDGDDDDDDDACAG